MALKPTSLTQYVSLLREGVVQRLNGSAHAGVVMAGAYRDRYVDRRVRKKTLHRTIFHVGDVECWVLDWNIGPPELWVPSLETKKSYGKIFRRFLSLEFGIDFDEHNAEEHDRFQIDHAHCSVSVLHNQDADFVLLTPLAGRVNAAWGRIERALAANNYREGPEALCSFLTMGKLLGLRPPRYSKRTNALKEANRFVGLLEDAGVDLSFMRDMNIQGVEQLILQAKNGERKLAEKAKANSAAEGADVPA